MITCILFISRLSYLAEVFKTLRRLDKPSGTELLLIVDSIDKPLLKFIDEQLDNLRFSTIKVKNTGNIAPMNLLNDRRYRISSLHNLAKHGISDNCEFVFLIEDDGTFAPDTLTKLLKQYSGKPELGFIQGIELGRWSAPYAGSWLADDIYNPITITSQMPKEDIMEMDAGGFYCALTRADLYKQHTFAPFDTEGTNGLSCDLNYGLSLRRLGYKCITDWTCPVNHIGERGSVNMGNTTPVQLQFKKGEDDKWTCVRV